MFVLDLICGTVDNDIDTTVGTGSWIGEAIIDGDIKDGAGTLLGHIHQDVNAK